MQVPDKERLRRDMRLMRQNQAPEVAARDSANILRAVRELPSVATAGTVLLYLPAKGEVDTWPLCEQCWNLGVRVLLPRCRDGQMGHMDIFEVTGREQLGPGCFGLTEPVPSKAKLANGVIPDVVIVPALAFDPKGYRLGYGGGYYDRFLPSLPRTTVTIGLAFTFQIVPILPVASWDQPVQMVITPDQTLIANKDILS